MSAVLSDLNRGASLRGDFPDLILVGPRRCKIDPLAVVRPAGAAILEFVRRHALRRAAAQLDFVNLCSVSVHASNAIHWLSGDQRGVPAPPTAVSCTGLLPSR